MLDYIEHITEIETVEDLWAYHCDRMEEFGFTRLVYGFSSHAGAQVLENPGDLTVLSNHDPAYVHRFIDGRLYLSSPMVHWALDNHGACSWRHAPAIADRIGCPAHEVLAFNAAHDVRAGYTISMHARGSHRQGMISLAAPPGTTQDKVDAVWDTHGRVIHAMNQIVHLKLSGLPQPATRALTPRQREVLEWIGQGKTIQDIAQIMGLTRPTVEKHLRLARETLGVDTTAQAVLRAAFQNQIYVPDRTRR